MPQTMPLFKDEAELSDGRVGVGCSGEIGGGGTDAA